jgi:hypothetical protein
MRPARLLRASIAMGVVLALLACSAAVAGKLTISVAKERSVAFAKRTCAHDKSCVESGVLNCRRQSSHIVLCRIFDRRKTEAQGGFVCSRLIRLALNPRSHRVPVTGLSRWNC